MVSFFDRLAGNYTQHVVREVGDFVLRRSDGMFAYQLAVVVDDALMGITDVVRGHDLLDSTARQILLFQALEAPAPDYWHVPVMLDASGRRMAKRFGSTTVLALREAGESAQRIVGLLAASVGLVDPGEALMPRDLLQRLDLEDFETRLRAGPRAGHTT